MTDCKTTGFKSFGPKTWLPQLTVVVGTFGTDGKPDFSTVAWVGTACSDPQELAVSLRPMRLAYVNITAKRSFTVMLFGADRAAEVDFCGTTSGRDHDKASELGWTVVPSSKVDAPYVTEAAMVFECRLKESNDLGAHTLLVGEIINVLVRSDCLDESTGLPDIHKVNPTMFDCVAAKYFMPGPFIGKAFEIGAKLKKK